MNEMVKKRFKLDAALLSATVPVEKQVAQD
jgi:hypothetical protein